jgi:hypothetical protein
MGDRGRIPEAKGERTKENGRTEDQGRIKNQGPKDHYPGEGPRRIEAAS